MRKTFAAAAAVTAGIAGCGGSTVHKETPRPAPLIAVAPEKVQTDSESYVRILQGLGASAMVGPKDVVPSYCPQRGEGVGMGPHQFVYFLSSRAKDGSGGYSAEYRYTTGMKGNEKPRLIEVTLGKIAYASCNVSTSEDISFRREDPYDSSDRNWQAVVGEDQESGLRDYMFTTEPLMSDGYNRTYITSSDGNGNVLTASLEHQFNSEALGILDGMTHGTSTAGLNTVVATSQ